MAEILRFPLSNRIGYDRRILDIPDEAWERIMIDPNRIRGYVVYLVAGDASVRGTPIAAAACTGTWEAALEIAYARAAEHGIPHERIIDCTFGTPVTEIGSSR